MTGALLDYLPLSGPPLSRLAASRPEYFSSLCLSPITSYTTTIQTMRTTSAMKRMSMLPTTTTRATTSQAGFRPRAGSARALVEGCPTSRAVVPAYCKRLGALLSFLFSLPDLRECEVNIHKRSSELQSSLPLPFPPVRLSFVCLSPTSTSLIGISAISRSTSSFTSRGRGELMILLTTASAIAASPFAISTRSRSFGDLVFDLVFSDQLTLFPHFLGVQVSEQALANLLRRIATALVRLSTTLIQNFSEGVSREFELG